MNPFKRLAARSIAKVMAGLKGNPQFGDLYASLTPVTVYVDMAWRAFAGGLIALMPNFGSYSPLADLVSGRAVGIGHVAMAGAVLFCIKGGLALLVGMFFYSRRELAQTIV